jgi:hypothetical protein
MSAQNGQIHQEAQMTKQSFGSIWHRAILQRKRWNG